MRTLKCPNCSASLTIQDDNRDFAFCEFCGTKIMLDDYRSTHRVVDEAKIRQAEVEREIKLKKIELIEKQQIAKQKKIKVKMIISFSLVGITLFAGLIDSFAFIMLPLVLMIVFIIWFTDIVKSTQPNNDLMILSDYVRVPDGVIGYKNMSYDMIAKMFENAGFHNIQLVPMGDVVLGVFNTPNLVDRILINNEMIIQGGGTYSPGARVVIYYHSSKF